MVDVMMEALIIAAKTIRDEPIKLQVTKRSCCFQLQILPPSKNNYHCLI